MSLITDINERIKGLISIKYELEMQIEQVNENLNSLRNSRDKAYAANMVLTSIKKESNANECNYANG